MTYYARNFEEAMTHYERMLRKYGHARVNKISDHYYYVTTYDDRKEGQK